MSEAETHKIDNKQQRGEMAKRIARETSLPERGVAAVLSLLDDGGTVPFIARYRKEATGSLDEVAIVAVRDTRERFAELDKRREAILSSCETQGVLTEALRKSLEGAQTMSELEDLYLPYRPKRRTRASVAKEKGLDGLAVAIMKQKPLPGGLSAAAARYVSAEKGVMSAEDALAGARDIIAEAMSEQGNVRARMRQLFVRRATIAAAAPKKLPEDGEASKYQGLLDTETPVANAPSHRILALFRGEREGFLKLRLEPEEGAALGILRAAFLRGSGAEAEQVELALRDSYKRLLAPSMETELRAALKEAADDGATAVFAKNLRAILMASPYGSKRVLGVDPGFRSGCKVVVLNEQGDLLHNETVYPHPPQGKAREAGEAVARLVKEYRIDAAAVGNGTAGRETEDWLRALNLPVEVIMVNESGASVYSASEVARQEFPDLDLTVRGAVSIGRRLQDPLAELVKIDPKSIGVGQYQHDVDQKKLKGSLDDVVVSCVNQVGVDVNSASRELLQYVAGLSPTLAANVVKRRTEAGPFRSRAELRGVPRLGPKAFEQSAGFLRIHGGENPLDASAVHPENYGTVERIAADLGCTVGELMRDESLRARIEPERYESVGRETLRDILAELAKPGRDPREVFERFAFADVHEIGDLKPGMTLPGIVSNVTDFGAFVDVGVHQDGLVHVSKMKGKYGKALAPGARVYVEVLQVDEARRRIALGLAEKPESRAEG